MSKLIIMCGVPGCGKSTWARAFTANHNAIVISRDAIRFSLLREEEDYFTHEEDVVKSFYQQINDYLFSGEYEYIIADATHNTKKARNSMLNRINREKAEGIILVDFSIDLKTCLEQNSRRSGREKVPEDVIRNMYKYFQKPDFDEKYEYNEIWHVRG